MNNSENKLKDPIFYILNDNCLVFERELEILIDKDNLASFVYLKFRVNEKTKGFDVNTAKNNIHSEVKVRLPSASKIQNFTILQIFQMFQRNSITCFVLFGIYIEKQDIIPCKIIIPLNQEKLLILED